MDKSPVKIEFQGPAHKQSYTHSRVHGDSLLERNLCSIRTGLGIEEYSGRRATSVGNGLVKGLLEQ
jgi:hypothetical protein